MSEANREIGQVQIKQLFLLEQGLNLQTGTYHILRNLFVQIWRPLVLVKIKEKTKINNSIGD